MFMRSHRTEGGEYRRAVATNFTLDDASANIYYIDFPAVQVSAACAAAGTCAYGNTLHQASLPSASAAFEVTGSAFYLYGLLSPTSGPFTVTVDGQTYGSLTAFCETTISQALLFHKEGLDPSSAHQVVLRNGGPSSSVSLDYVIATSGGNAVGPVAYPPTSSPNGGSGTPAGGAGSAGGANVQPGIVGGTSTDAFGAPIAAPTTVEKDSNGDQIGAIIGAVAGVIIFLLIAIFWYRYYMYRKRGGKGDFWEALFGERRKKQEKKAEEEAEEKWRNWPMLRYVPTYSTKDLTEENDRLEKEEADRKKKSSSSRS